MKLAILCLLFAMNVFAGEQSEADKKMQILLERVNQVSEKKLDDKKDLTLVKQALKDLLELDKMDETRTGVAMLAGSYADHKALYDRAAKQIETSKNKKSLKEILGMLKKLSTSGNG